MPMRGGDRQRGGQREHESTKREREITHPQLPKTILNFYSLTKVKRNKRQH